MVKIQQHAATSIIDFPLCPHWSIPSFHSANISKLHFRVCLRAADTADNPASQHVHCGWGFCKYTHWGWSFRLPIIVLIKAFNIYVRVFLAQPTSLLAHLDRTQTAMALRKALLDITRGVWGTPGLQRWVWEYRKGKTERKIYVYHSQSKDPFPLYCKIRQQSPHTSTWCAHPWIGNLQPYSTRVPCLTSYFWKIALGRKKSVYFHNIF